MALHHGIGAGRFRGSKSTNLERLANVYPGADIYMEGHTHTFDFFVNKMQYVDRKRGNLVDYPAYFCTTAHFLNWRGSYGEEKKYVPSIEGCAMLKLFHSTSGNFNRKKVHGNLAN